MIPVIFKCNRKEFKSYALIDSGSDYTILPIEIAGKLSLRLDNHLRFSILAAGGHSFTIYKSSIEIEYIIKKKGFREIKWKSNVFFAESGSTILLGQNGFLDKFKITLNGKNREVEIKHQ